MKNYLSKLSIGWSVFFLVALSGVGLATPSTNIWNPSTDIQAAGIVHLGIDNYFTLDGPAQGGYAFPTDTGLTYGVFPGLEVGIDVFLPQTSPLVLNAKYGIAESGILPSLAIGGFGFGTQPGVTDQNAIYGLGSKVLPMIGRITAGYFTGNDKVLLDPTGAKDNNGLILAWDKSLTDKLWVSIDYAGTKSALGAAFYGFSWLFVPNTSIIFAYGTYNNGAKPTVTTQLDINI